MIQINQALGVQPHRSKLLLVDDEDAILKIMKSVLEKEGFEITVANSGKAAMELTGLSEFQAVISDINMPGTDGLQLLKHIRNAHPSLPVILMTGFAKILETKEAFALGASGFLAKPFKHGDLMSVLGSTCGTTQLEKYAVKAAQEILAESHNNYCRIGMDQFISGKSIDFPIFIRLGEKKYIKVAHKGEDINVEWAHTLKGKHVEFLYIKTDDFAQYVGFNLKLSRAVKNNRAIPQEKKIQLAKNASTVIMENIFVNGVTQESFLQAKEITETTLALLSECPKTFDLLLALESCGDPLYTHSLGVSLYSALIAKQIGWTSPGTIFKVSTAGMFHDIGLKEIDRAIIEKHRSTLSIKEIKQFETHPARAVEILGGIPEISNEILQAILQHHESGDGRGFPSKLPRGKIIPMACLLSVADEFCELALASPNSPGLSAKDAMERLTTVSTSVLDSKFIDALKIVLGLGKVTGSKQ